MLKADYYTEPTELDRLLFEKLVPRDHVLRLIKSAIDFDACRDVVADCYSPTMGRGAEDPVRMLKLCLLQFLHDLSDQDVVDQAQVNVAFRFFLDLSVESQTPSSSLLSQFRSRLGAERFRAVFNQILAQARARDLVSDRLRLKDATHLLAAVAIPTTLALVAQARDRVVGAGEVFEPEAAGARRAEAERVRETTRGLRDAQRLVARVEHLRQVVSWGEEVLERVRGQREATDTQRRALEVALELAHKVLRDGEGGTAGGEKGGGTTGKDKLRSLRDPDVRRSRHGIWYDGYMLDLLVDADSELITALDVLAANANEASNTKVLIEAEEAAHGNDIEAVSIDAVGFRGDVLAELTEAGGPEVTVFVPARDQRADEQRGYGPEQFQLDESGQEVTCPAGHTTRAVSKVKDRLSRRFTFPKRACRDCPLREACQPGGGRTGRSVVKNDYEAQYRAAREVAQTEAYREVRRQHPRVERKLNEMVRHHAGRRVRYWGRDRVRVQYYLVAVVVNLKRMVKLMGQAASCAEAA